MQPCIFTFDETQGEWSGFTDGTQWNGFDNVNVTPEVFASIKAYWEKDDPDEFAQMDAATWDVPTGEDGLVSLANGWATTIKEVSGI